MKKQLIEDNMSLVYFLVNSYYPTYSSDEDIIQCGMLGLCKAAETWKDDGTKFSTYAGKCILNEINMEFRRRKKHSGLLSLDYEYNSKGDNDVTLKDLLIGDNDVDYVEYDKFYNQLQDIDKVIVDCKLVGYIDEDIGKQLGCSRQYVNRRLNRLKAEWRMLNGD